MAEKAKAMKLKVQKLEDPKQSDRFMETTRELGVDESGASFERAVEKNLPSKLRKAIYHGY